MHWLNNISIKWRILMSFFFFLFLFIAFGTFSLFQMKTLFNLTQNLYDHPFTVSNAAQRANTGVIRIHRTMKDVSTSTNAFELQQAIIEVQYQERLVYQNLDIVKNNILGVEGKELVQETIDMFAGWKPIRKMVIDLVAAENYEEARDITKNKGANYVDKLERQMAELSGYAHSKAKGFLMDASSVWQGIAVLIILLIIIVTLIFVFILTVVLRSINRNISHLVDTMSLFHTTGNLKKADIIGTNEISDLSSHFNNLIERLEIQIWQRDGLNLFNEELSGEPDYSNLLQKGINFICRFVEACVGAVYSYSEQEQCSQLVSSYAFVERQYIANKFRNGEGIVGQVALEKTPILLNNIQRNEAEGISGTAAEVPKHIYALPLIYEGRLLGVLEIASFTEINENKREVLDECGKIMSTFSNAARQNQRVQELYSITQQANKDLESKTKELNASNEQLSALNQELQFQADELKVQKAELERQRQQVQEADRLKSEFLSNMSHELRTPLNSVLALSQLMIRQGTGKDTEKEHEYLNIIERNGRRLLSLINDILDLSKIEAGRVELETSKFSSSELMKRVVETVTPLVNTDKVTLDLNVEENLQIQSDERKIQQIMLNLVSNAVKFTESGSIKLKVCKDNNEVHWSVEDTGIGIEPGEMDNIFSEFRQVDGSISRKHEGTGLGLAISQKLAEKLGGTINVESTLGKGSTFTLQLPEKTQTDLYYEPSNPEGYTSAQHSLEANPKEFISEKKPVLLIVEDNEVTALQIHSILKEENYSFLMASSGLEAVKILKHNVPDAVILDLMMPEMDSFQVLEYLQLSDATMKTPVLILTAKDLTEQHREKLVYNNVQELTHQGSINKDQLLSAINGLFAFKTDLHTIKRNPVSQELLNEGKPFSKEPRDCKILIVEDNPDNLVTIGAILDTLSYNHISVAHGEKALDMMKLENPDLVLMDIQLPGLSGIDAIKKVRKDPELSKIPVVCLTAKAMKGDKESLLKEGFDDYVSKPIDPDEVRVVLKKWIKT